MKHANKGHTAMSHVQGCLSVSATPFRNQHEMDRQSRATNLLVSATHPQAHCFIQGAVGGTIQD